MRLFFFYSFYNWNFYFRFNFIELSLLFDHKLHKRVILTIRMYQPLGRCFLSVIGEFLLIFNLLGLAFYLLLFFFSTAITVKNYIWIVFLCTFFLFFSSFSVVVLFLFCCLSALTKLNIWNYFIKLRSNFCFVDKIWIAQEIYFCAYFFNYFINFFV